MEGGWNGGDMRINIHDISLGLKGILSECQTKEFMVDLPAKKWWIVGFIKAGEEQQHVDKYSHLMMVTTQFALRT